ncbi:MAG: hypothetical protein E7589_02725 [Ruminococcaceae bacterium]|nr:hypothetical protein [Oscillospiraceae bacterium]
MKKIISLALCVVTVVCLMLSSCSGGAKLTDKNGSACVDAKNGITYKYASVCYEPVALGDEYGELKVGEKLTYKLYTVPDMKESEWLATDDKNILYAEGVSLPTLSEMKPRMLRICTTESSGLEICRIGDGDTVSAIARAFEEGERVAYPLVAAEKKYKVKFDGEVLSGICYSLTYLEYAENIEVDGVSRGRYFLYDAFDRVFVPVGDEIHAALAGEGAGNGAVTTDVGGAV